MSYQISDSLSLGIFDIWFCFLKIIFKERNVNKTFKCIEIYDKQSMVKKETYSLQLKTYR